MSSSSSSSSENQSLGLAEKIAEIASDRKAIDVRLLDLRGVVGYTDYFVICTGNTERQTKAIHDAIHKELKDSSGLLPRRTEGDRQARWVLLDYLDFVVHVFHTEEREYYELERLWRDADRVDVGEDGSVEVPSGQEEIAGGRG